ncbi:hypothetical protein CPB84DRAFT_1769389 [Gymnopilus junonius]|uniref:Alpha-ketoglutarate-dependent dioxygenase AlkB-like domain-containing protein n=1 Tax=Gymnopilus junonius TaxID=109634 RepID=A0A9P5NWW7_GYMJU|nr:hypothetical protein CPB84DRAFT_1769389 [Gymnopilus junonius]
MKSINQTRNRVPKTPVLGVGDELGSGDSYLVTNMLPPELADVAFENMKTEVKWNTMHHRGGDVPRLVAVEGEVREDGSFPVYRFPSDESPPLLPFSPTVALIREHVQKVLNHPVNHDYISEHSDKTIDVVRGSYIVNVSLGAQRTMILYAKKDRASRPPGSSSPDAAAAETPGVAGSGNHPGTPRASQRIPLPNNSMFVMGLETNAKWRHAINHDNRSLRTKSPEEQHIGTFISKDESRIWGQARKGRRRRMRGKVHKLLLAFGDENQQSKFDWEAAYGCGFDVLHMTEKEDNSANPVQSYAGS